MIQLPHLPRLPTPAFPPSSFHAPPFLPPVWPLGQAVRLFSHVDAGLAHALIRKFPSQIVLSVSFIRYSSSLTVVVSDYHGLRGSQTCLLWLIACYPFELSALWSALYFKRTLTINRTVILLLSNPLTPYLYLIKPRASSPVLFSFPCASCLYQPIVSPI